MRNSIMLSNELKSEIEKLLRKHGVDSLGGGSISDDGKTLRIALGTYCYFSRSATGAIGRKLLEKYDFEKVVVDGEIFTATPGKWV